MPDTEPTLADEIERLESEIGDLQDAIRRSRRLTVVGRVCAVAGVGLLGGLMFGLAVVTPLRMIIGFSLAIGGVVLMGSSVGSTRQFELSLRRASDARNAAIDALELVPLGDEAG